MTSTDQPRKLYGTIELAERLGIEPGNLRVRLSRGQIPEPDDYASNRPVWFAETIDKWLGESPKV